MVAKRERLPAQVVHLRRPASRAVPHHLRADGDGAQGARDRRARRRLQALHTQSPTVSRRPRSDCVPPTQSGAVQTIQRCIGWIACTAQRHYTHDSSAASGKARPRVHITAQQAGCIMTSTARASIIDKAITTHHWRHRHTGELISTTTPANMVHIRHTFSLMPTQAMYNGHWTAEAEHVARAFLHDPMWIVPAAQAKYPRAISKGCKRDAHEAAARVTTRRRLRYLASKRES